MGICGSCSFHYCGMFLCKQLELYTFVNKKQHYLFAFATFEINQHYALPCFHHMVSCYLVRWCAVCFSQYLGHRMSSCLAFSSLNKLLFNDLQALMKSIYVLSYGFNVRLCIHCIWLKSLPKSISNKSFKYSTQHLPTELSA